MQTETQIQMHTIQKGEASSTEQQETIRPNMPTDKKQLQHWNFIKQQKELWMHHVFEIIANLYRVTQKFVHRFQNVTSQSFNIKI